MSSDTHDKIIRAVQNYCKWQDSFETRGYDESGIKARNWLNEIRKLIMLRREEIMNKRIELKAARKGKPGRPPKVTK